MYLISGTFFTARTVVPISVRSLINVLRGIGARIPASEREWWTSLGLDDYSASRTATRLEAAVVIDATFKPFESFGVDYNGNLRR